MKLADRIVVVVVCVDAFDINGGGRVRNPRLFTCPARLGQFEFKAIELLVQQADLGAIANLERSELGFYSRHFGPALMVSGFEV